MKIRTLISQLSTLDPDGEVQGTEFLVISSKLFSSTKDTARVLVPKKKKFLKGAEREACATEPGDPHTVALKYGVSTATVWTLRREFEGP